MINEQLGLDDLVRKFKGYVLGENGFDELDFKEAILELIKEENKELLDALYSMYRQYCNDKWGHQFMSAGEKASELLENAGYIVVDNIGAIIKDNYNYGDSK